eukprot:5230204-Prymnesium_polylepis.1
MKAGFGEKSLRRHGVQQRLCSLCWAASDGTFPKAGKICKLKIEQGRPTESKTNTRGWHYVRRFEDSSYRERVSQLQPCAMPSFAPREWSGACEPSSRSPASRAIRPPMPVTA